MESDSEANLEADSDASRQASEANSEANAGANLEADVESTSEANLEAIQRGTFQGGGGHMIQFPIRARGFFAVNVLGLTGELHIQFAVIGTAPAVASVFHAPLVSAVGFGEPPETLKTNRE